MTDQIQQQALARADVPSEQKWDIEALYATREDWQKDAQAVAVQIKSLGQYRDQLGEASQLLAFLQAYDAVMLRISRLRGYASMSTSVDSSDTDAVKLAEQSRTLSAEFGRETAFFAPELYALPEEQLQAHLALPEFADQRIRLERLLRQKPHTRSSEVEALLSELSVPFGSANAIHPTLANMDMVFGHVEQSASQQAVTQSSLDSLLAHPKREVRRQAWEQYADTHLALKHSQAGMYLTNVRQNVFLARTRHYADAISASLLPQQISPQVVSTLLDTYRANTHVWERYWQVRRRWLGLSELREYDVKAPLVPPQAVSYQQAVEWLQAGMAPLGSDYVEQMVRGLTSERWVDYAGNAGKRQGAYSNSAGNVKPYIFMTWTDSMGSYSTLAHEIGHSMHSYLAMQEHPISVPRYTLFHAEVASNFNQAMTRQYLLRQARAEQNVTFEINILEEALSNFHRYFFIMPTLAAFEWECYRRIEAGQALSAPDLIELMADLLAQGYGSGVSMDRQRSGSMWMQFSTHLYANFYAYQYATGISAAHQLLEQFEQQPEQARSNYLAFLRSGGALDPIDALAQAGVDMLTPAPVQATFRVLEGYVARLEELLAQR